MRLGRRSLSMPRGDGHIVQQHCLSTRRRMTDCGREHRGLYRPLLARVPAGAGTFGASSTDRRSTPEHSLPVPSLATNGVLTPLSFVITALTHFHPRRMNALAFLIRLSVHESRADALLANQICNRAVLQASRERVGPARTPLSPAAPSELRRVPLCGDEVGRGARHRACAPPAHGSKANSPPVACLRRPAFLSVFSVSSWASESSTNAGHGPRGTRRGSLSDGRLGLGSAGARLDASHGKQRGTPPATCRWPARSPVGLPPPKRVRRVLAKRTVARAPSQGCVDVRPSSGVFDVFRRPRSRRFAVRCQHARRSFCFAALL